MQGAKIIMGREEDYEELQYFKEKLYLTAQIVAEDSRVAQSSDYGRINELML